MKLLFTIETLLACCFTMQAQKISQVITVAPDGSGDHRTIQGAINSIPDSTRIGFIIFIRNGVYNEKLYIEKPNIVLEGESRDSTIIVAAIARDSWRCNHTDDWGVATLNVGANDLTLRNLTITNAYGFLQTGEVEITCAADSTGKKVIRRNSHQMALRAMNCTRLRAINCHFRSFGGDTVSPWNTVDGMWYFKDCIMEGSVDLYCPRGWAWAENCIFIAHSGTAIVWHDGSGNADAKSVLLNCRFKGYDGFQLGRYHREAQLLFIGCVFDANMANTPVYHAPSGPPLQWGHRVYFSGCRKAGGVDFEWYRNRLPAGITEQQITVDWVFGKCWHPHKS
ncbi:MAG TPA: pectinesterase family protein [Lacibacter sp.]|nr:pectinesterase family protein [Lacibacter sp.]HMO89200.1 pectinesterase family protein [Lacibacter sp.]HMP87914.1 pectinesterase family protein [Lacibacter sp.]